MPRGYAMQLGADISQQSSKKGHDYQYVFLDVCHGPAFLTKGLNRHLHSKECCKFCHV